jgi:hypothetical protein
VQEARQRNVGHVPAAAGDETRVLAPSYPCSEQPLRHHVLRLSLRPMIDRYTRSI